MHEHSDLSIETAWCCLLLHQYYHVQKNGDQNVSNVKCIFKKKKRIKT